MQQKIMSRTKMLSVNPRITRELQDRNVYFKRCTVGEVYSIWYKCILKKSFFSKRAFLAFHRFHIKTWLKWCISDAPPSDSSPFPHFLNHFRKQSIEIIFTSVLAQNLGKGVIECYCLIGVQQIQPKGSLWQQAKCTIEKIQRCHQRHKLSAAPAKSSTESNFSLSTGA